MRIEMVDTPTEEKIEMDQEEVNPTGDGARSERQEWGASRKLDAEVAERVMGLVPCQSPNHEQGTRFYMARPCHALPESPDRGGETRCYSSDIAAALEVVESLGQRVEIVYVPKTALPWMVWLRGGERTFRETLPEAICRAALALVEGNKETN